MTTDVTECHAGGLDVSEACVTCGICQHHGAAYAEFETAENPGPVNIAYEMIATTGTIVQVQITTTETCCIIVNAALLTASGWAPTNFEIERPKGTIRTQQEYGVVSNATELMHHAAWEVLNAGSYTYYLVNRSGSGVGVYAAWIKAVASDCLG